MFWYSISIRLLFTVNGEHMRVYWKIHWLKKSYDDILFVVDNFLTIGIQARQHRWKKSIDLKEALSHSIRVSWSADPRNL